MALGHILGFFSEPVTKSICNTFLHNNYICSTTAVLVHEVIIEPSTNAFVSCMMEKFDWHTPLTLQTSDNILLLLQENLPNILEYEFTTRVLGSILVSKFAEYYLGDNIWISGATGLIGSYTAAQIYNYYIDESESKEVSIPEDLH